MSSFFCHVLILIEDLTSRFFCGWSEFKSRGLLSFLSMEAEDLYWIFGWLFTAVAISGNTLVIYLILAKRHLRKKPNWFILSLATADLFVGFTYIPPFYACRECFSCSEHVWFVMKTIQWLFLYASVCNLFILTLDRYIAVTSPLKHKRCLTLGRIAILALTAWFIPVIFRVCIYTPIYLKNKEIASKYLVPLFMVMFEFVLCIALPFFTFRMVHIVRNLRKSRGNSENLEHSSIMELRSSTIRIHVSEERRRNYNINVVVCVVILFIICYSVNLYTSVCSVFNLCSISQELWYIRHLLLVANSALNPVAYALLKRDMKRAILALGRSKSNNQVSPVSVVNWFESKMIHHSKQRQNCVTFSRVSPARGVVYVCHLQCVTHSRPQSRSFSSWVETKWLKED